MVNIVASLQPGLYASRGYPFNVHSSVVNTVSHLFLIQTSASDGALGATVAAGTDGLFMG